MLCAPPPCVASRPPATRVPPAVDFRLQYFAQTSFRIPSASHPNTICGKCQQTIVVPFVFVTVAVVPGVIVVGGIVVTCCGCSCFCCCCCCCVGCCSCHCCCCCRVMVIVAVCGLRTPPVPKGPRRAGYAYCCYCCWCLSVWFLCGPVLVKVLMVIRWC